MRLSTSILALSAALGVQALPAHSKADMSSLFTRQMGGVQRCMTEQEAKDAVEIYRQLIADYTPELGEKWVSSGFVDSSDSINTFVHRALGAPTFPTKAAFMASQEYTMHFPIQILSVDAVHCNTVALQWRARFGDANLPSKGLTIMKTVSEDGVWRIAQIDVEFNALTWLLNMGGSYSWEGKTYTGASPDPALVPKPMDGE